MCLYDGVEAWMKGLQVVVELQPQLFLDSAAGCFVTGFDCYERIKVGKQVEWSMASSRMQQV